jgi:hypothetical protein
VAEVGLVLLARALEVGDQRSLDRRRQHRHPILAALAVADDDLVRREVDVLHAEAAFQQAKSRAVQQQRHEAWRAIEPLEDCTHLVTGERHGQMLRPLGPDDIVEPRELDAEHLAIEKEQGAQSVVLGRGRHFVVNGKRGQECRDLGGAQLSRVALAVEGLPWKKMYRLIQWM